MTATFASTSNVMLCYWMINRLNFFLETDDGAGDSKAQDSSRHIYITQSLFSYFYILNSFIQEDIAIRKYDKYERSEVLKK